MKLMGKDVVLHPQPGPLDEQEVTWRGADLWRLIGSYFGYSILVAFILAVIGFRDQLTERSPIMTLSEGLVVLALFHSHSRHHFWPSRAYWRLQLDYFQQHWRQGAMWGLCSHLGSWVIAMLCALAASAFGSSISAVEGNNPLRGTPLGIWWLLSAISIVTLTPLIEELFMRGMFYSWLRKRYGVRVGLLVSSLVFAAVHGSLLLFLSMLFSGFVFGLLYERTGSLAPSMIAHATHNLISISLTLVVALL